MRARYYDADTGRFISEDPIGFEGGINLYAYCNNNPVNFVDPSGLAYFGKRPLGSRGDMINNPVLDTLNLEVSHEHIVFDQPQMIGDLTVTNIGFGPNGPEHPTGLFTEGVSLNNLGNYQITGVHYNDDIIAQAINNLGGGEYNFILHNCQDWAGSVRKEYARLKNA